MKGKEAARVFNVPAALWDSKFEDCTARDVMENYIAMRKADEQMRRLGVGLYFRGPAGRGKTTSAVQLVRRVYEDGFYPEEKLPPDGPELEKELERRFKMTWAELDREVMARRLALGPRIGWGGGANLSVYFTRAADLRNNIRYQRPFREHSVLDLLKLAKVVIIDDLTAADFSDQYMNWLNLVVDRSNFGLTTFFTSILSFAELNEISKLWSEQVGNILFEVELSGDNRREDLITRVATGLFKPQSSEGKSEPA